MQHFQDWISTVRGKPPYPPANSPLEQLPNELLFRILDLLVFKQPTTISGIREWFMFDNLPSPPNVAQPAFSVFPCLLVSRRIHDVALPIFYRVIKLAQEEFAAEGPNFKLIRSIHLNPCLAPLVRTLDLREFLIPDCSHQVPRALTLLPRLRSLHLQLGELRQLEDRDIQTVFFGIPDLDTLVIENTRPKTHPGCLADVLRTLESVDPKSFSRIRSLTCRSDSGSIYLWPPADRVAFVDVNIFSSVLPRFPKLKVLDLAYTPVDTKSFSAIDSNARLEFLRITDCQDNDTSTLAHFLATHPAVRSSLVVFDGTGVRFSERDTTTILENLPPTLRSLNLSSSMMTAKQVPLLQNLYPNLEELSVGYGLTMNDAEAIILGPHFDFDAADVRRSVNGTRNSKDPSEHELVLGPMRDAIAVCKLRRRLTSVSPTHRHKNIGRSRIRYLNLSSMDEEEQGRITNSVLLGEHSMPLRLIVVSDINIEDHHVLKKLSGGCGWRDKCINGIVWVERS